jgi:hypothetical protein
LNLLGFRDSFHKDAGQLAIFEEDSGRIKLVGGAPGGALGRGVVGIGSVSLAEARLLASLEVFVLHSHCPYQFN